MNRLFQHVQWRRAVLMHASLEHEEFVGKYALIQYVMRAKYRQVISIYKNAAKHGNTIMLQILDELRVSSFRRMILVTDILEVRNIRSLRYFMRTRNLMPITVYSRAFNLSNRRIDTFEWLHKYEEFKTLSVHTIGAMIERDFTGVQSEAVNCILAYYPDVFNLPVFSFRKLISRQSKSDFQEFMRMFRAYSTLSENQVCNYLEWTTALEPFNLCGRILQIVQEMLEKSIHFTRPWKMIGEGIPAEGCLMVFSDASDEVKTCLLNSFITWNRLDVLQRLVHLHRQRVHCRLLAVRKTRLQVIGQYSASPDQFTKWIRKCGVPTSILGRKKKD